MDGGRLIQSLSAEARAELDLYVAEQVARSLDGLQQGTPWMSVTEGAEYLRLSPAMLRKLIASGKLEAHGVGRRRLVHRDDLDALVRGGGSGGSASHPRPRRRPVP